MNSGHFAKFFMFLFVMALFSCAKFQERKIIKGTWEIMEGRINADTVSLDAMALFLKHYRTTEDCCHYIITFDGDNTATGRYYTFDTLNYSVTGTWHMIDKDWVYVNIDEYANGEFFIDRKNRKDYVLTSDYNTIIRLSGLVAPVEFKIKRLDI